MSDIYGWLPVCLWVTFPNDAVLELALKQSRVHNPFDFIFQLAFNLNWWGWRCSASRDRIAMVGFQQGYMEDRMGPHHIAWQL
jgi:hypothetical protein